MKIDEVGDRCVRRITRGFLNGRRPICVFYADTYCVVPHRLLMFTLI